MRQLSEIEIALQRIAENARARGDDIAYAHRQENNEYIYLLEQSLLLVKKVENSLLDDLARFRPVEQNRPRVVGNGPPKDPPPAFLQQGPRTEKEVK